jgi:hypothetical protein
MSWFSTTVLSFFRIGVEFPHSAEISGIVGGVSADVTTEQRTGMIYYAARIAIEPHESASRRRQAGAGNAGRSLHQDRRSYWGVLSDQAAI